MTILADDWNHIRRFRGRRRGRVVRTQYHRLATADEEVKLHELLSSYHHNISGRTINRHA